jgi:DNA-binding XRE family transcriptional regulator
MTIGISAQRISGAPIKDGRELLGRAQRQLAGSADLSRETVSRIEREGREGRIY